MGEFFLFIYLVIFQINLGNTLRENRGQPIEVESAEKTKKQNKTKKSRNKQQQRKVTGPNWLVTSGRRHTRAAAHGNYFQVPFFFGTVFRFLFFIETKYVTEVKIPWR